MINEGRIMHRRVVDLLSYFKTSLQYFTTSPAM